MNYENQLIKQDWEKEFNKNYIYLYEREKEIEQEYYEYINRLPGEIIVINVPKQENNKHRFNYIKNLNKHETRNSFS